MARAPLGGRIRVAGESLASEVTDPPSGESGGVSYGETTTIGPDGGDTAAPKQDPTPETAKS